MDLKYSDGIVTIKMAPEEFLRLTDLISMAEVGFDALDKSISTGGDMSAKDMNNLFDAWASMTKKSSWPARAATNELQQGRA